MIKRKGEPLHETSANITGSADTATTAPAPSATASGTSDAAVPSSASVSAATGGSSQPQHRRNGSSGSNSADNSSHYPRTSSSTATSVGSGRPLILNQCRINTAAERVTTTPTTTHTSGSTDRNDFGTLYTSPPSSNYTLFASPSECMCIMCVDTHAIFHLLTARTVCV